MHIFTGPTERPDRKRRLARTKPGVIVESLEGRQLLSHMGTLPKDHGHHQADVSTLPDDHGNDQADASTLTEDHGHHHASVSTLDNSSGHNDNNGGEVRKDPHYFEIFDNIGKRPDLNAVRASVTLHEHSNVLTFEGRMQGKINTAPADASQNSLFVFGVNRGSPKAIAPFALRQGVVFDSVVVVSINNVTGISATVVDIAGGTRTALSADHVHIDGREVRVDVDASLLPTPTGGVSVEHYTFNLWPREAGGPDSTIASFIPENSMAPIVVEGHHHGN